MPAISLVVCLCNQRDLLERLLRESSGHYDDLVVVHDGPDETGARATVEAAGGRFFERPLERQQERHWPFAWAQAKLDWILRLDADEFPGREMKAWLQEFRRISERPATISGFTCIWPSWDGRQTISKKWPAGHVFLFHRHRVRFFGMPEQGAIPDSQWEPLDFILHHQPKRKSYGLHNILIRKQAYRWRDCIAHSLLGKPTDLPCWRWENEEWPVEWEQIRQHPLQTALRRLVMETFRGLCSGWRAEKKFFPNAALMGPVHHALICLKYWQVRRRHLREMASEKSADN